MSEQPPTVTATVEALEAATNGRWGIWLSDTGWWWAARTQTLAAAELAAGCLHFIHADNPDELAERIRQQDQLIIPRQAGRTAASTPAACSRTFPATAPHVREARLFLATILGEQQFAADALLCLSELATNAILHSRSREPGGSFTVHAQLDGQRLRVEVCDQGGPWHSPVRARAGELNGRGLLIVGQLASRWGCEGHSRYGWTVWYELDTGR
jgi:serine/threonine-protein kinase RsbW